jgi:heme-degrading monooxygenase HmoA
LPVSFRGKIAIAAGRRATTYLARSSGLTSKKSRLRAKRAFYLCFPQTRGFVEFHLLKGPVAEDHTLYASHTVWKNRATFEAWTKSEAFRAAHASAGSNKPLYLGHPQFERFEVLVPRVPASGTPTLSGDEPDLTRPHHFVAD